MCRYSADPQGLVAGKAVEADEQERVLGSTGICRDRCVRFDGQQLSLSEIA